MLIEKSNELDHKRTVTSCSVHRISNSKLQLPTRDTCSKSVTQMFINSPLKNMK